MARRGLAAVTRQGEHQGALKGHRVGGRFDSGTSRRVAPNRGSVHTDSKPVESVRLRA